MEKRNQYLDLVYLIFSFSTLVLVNILINPTKILSSSDTIIINEFVYDPLGTDLGYEWIELYNIKMRILILITGGYRLLARNLKMQLFYQMQLKTHF